MIWISVRRKFSGRKKLFWLRVGRNEEQGKYDFEYEECEVLGGMQHVKHMFREIFIGSHNVWKDVEGQGLFLSHLFSTIRPSEHREGRKELI